RLSPPVYCNPSRVIPNFSSRNAHNWIGSTNVSSTIWTSYGKRSASKPLTDPAAQREQNFSRDAYNGLRWLIGRRNKEAELEDELQFHLEEEAGERQAQGLAGEAALRAARRELGNLALVQEDTRAAWTWTVVEELVQDIRYGLRTIVANKTFSAMAIL